MTLLILGVALWAVAHFLKRVLPGPRAALGNAGKGAVALAIVASVALMILGYRGAETVDLWYPPKWLTHVNNLLMVLAFFFYTADGMKAGFVARMRHPQLTGFKTWTIAHLLVNGDLASVILFGGLLAWAVVTVIVINRSQREWTPKVAKPGAMPKALAATLVTVVVVMGIHNWLGVQPWGG